MKIKLTSILVDDQDKALEFYTKVLGFVKKRDLPAGKYRWLTVVSPDDADNVELLLEPNDNAAAKWYQQSIFVQGVPFTAFMVVDVQQEYERLKKLGVVFVQKPTNSGPTTKAIFNDTCGNFIQIYQSNRVADTTEENDIFDQLISYLN